MSSVRPSRALAVGVALAALSGLFVVGELDGVGPGADPTEVQGVSEAGGGTGDVAARGAAQVDPSTVVRIVAHGCGGRSVGSGVLVAGGRVLTARHVLDGATSATVDVPGVGGVAADVVALDAAGRDVALLELRDGDLASAAAPVDATLPASGSLVAAVGHPSGAALVRTDGAVIGSQTRGPLALDGGRVLTFDAVVEPGMSGGPVVDRAGSVVGVAIGFDRATRTGIAVPIGEITELLRGAGDEPSASCRPT